MGFPKPGKRQRYIVILTVRLKRGQADSTVLDNPTPSHTTHTMVATAQTCQPPRIAFHHRQTSVLSGEETVRWQHSIKPRPPFSNFLHPAHRRQFPRVLLRSQAVGP